MGKYRVVQVKTERKIPLFEKVCPVCGTKFEGPAQRDYCSDKCRKKANWQRHGAEYLENRQKKQEQKP